MFLPLLIFPCTLYLVQKFSSGTGSPGWSRKKGRKTVVVVVAEFAKYNLLLLFGEMVTDYNSGLA